MTPIKPRITSAEAIVGIWMLSVTVFVVATLYFTREILIPLALAALLTFLLAPLVTRLERWVGRIAAVLLIVALIFSAFGAAGWMLSRQLIDLGTRLPEYKENIRAKIRTFRAPQGGAMTKLSEAVEDLKKELPGTAAPVVPAVTPPPDKPETSVASPLPPLTPVVPVQVVETSRSNPLLIAESLVEPLIGPLGTAALVLVLVICMLFQREDLRNRIIRLIGQDRISATTRAMDDAGQRVSRFLLMQLLVNVTYGTVISIGLYFIGIPNAVLWGALGTVLRFIPYVGPWVAMILPTLLALAISPHWTVPLLTIGLFAGLELLLNNVMEPLLYGAHTGVSSIALIVAAVFWTWLWGPVGLVLATPLTVCLVVMGRHVPRLAFLSVLLSDEEALTPAEDCYYRLLTPSDRDEWEFVNAYLKKNSRTALYDAVLLPVLSTVETDARAEVLDETQRRNVEESMSAIIEELGTRPLAPADSAATETAPPAIERRVYCLPARADRDELAGAMLTQLLRERGFAAESASGHLAVSEMLSLVQSANTDAVVISVVTPTTATHARQLCQRVRTELPRLKIIIGLWNAVEELAESTRRLREAGADAVVTTLTEALAQVAQLLPEFPDEMLAAPIPADEEQRLVALDALHLPDTASPSLDRLAAKLARVFEVPLAFVAVVERDRQFFLGQSGLPEALASARQTQRNISFAGHVIARNETLAIDDLARDRRFANNPFRREYGLRFAVGVPLHAPNGQPIGALCLMDTKPRQFTPREARLLEEYAAEAEAELARNLQLESR
jgi:predicted PurR-regulated permease PerM/CheY-like chemotaxis protein